MDAHLNMDRECESCQGPFKPIKPNQKFCSPQCARKVRFARYGQRKALKLTGDSQEGSPRSPEPNETAENM